MANLDIHSTYYLGGLFDQIVPEAALFLDTFFSKYPVIQSNSEKVYFDDVPGKTKGASPFVSPRREAPTFGREGYETNEFKPAYIKEKIDLTPDLGFSRIPGEKFGGEYSPMQRLEYYLAQDLRRLKDRWRNRLELMAAELVKTGKLTVKGDGIDAQLDFGRDKSLNISLSGNNSWASPEFKMREFLNKRRSNMASKNRRNTSPNIAWIGADAEEMLLRNSELKEIVSDFRRDAEVRLRLSPGLQSFENLVYVGNFGSVDFFKLEAKDPEGKPFIGPKQMLLTTGDIHGVQMFGAIWDLKAKLVPTPVFMKSWEIESPSTRFVELQSAPILGSFDPNCAELIDIAS
ncbi:MAG TPA: major capsid protein [Oligoflexus sp.]|uniref:major capsid protein n=1 Tax=Oligoflexus sp. TaxID=1971216 RepID=UPI002D7EC4BF|nr:major capsid protein [Oligoflexus sp.]HET9235910.1 major capsid protein [Oligoflexus sp.]